MAHKETSDSSRTKEFSLHYSCQSSDYSKNELLACKDRCDFIHQVQSHTSGQSTLTLLAAKKSLMEIISPDNLRPVSVSLSLMASVSMDGSLRARRWPGATTFRRGCRCGW